MDDLKPSEAQIDAAISVLRDEIGMPYGPARIADYVSSGSEGEQRRKELAALRQADEEAEKLNRELVRRALRAAAEVPHG